MKRLVLLSWLVVCCTGASAQTQEPDPLSFFPHQVGDTWTYQYYHGRIEKTTVIKDSIDEEGRVYIWRLGFPFTMIDQELYVHNEPFILKRKEYKLDAQEGERWTVIPAGENGSLREDAIVDDVYKTYLFGRETTVKQISYYVLWPGSNSIEEGATYGYTRWLASGIGVVQELLEGSIEMEYMLTGCVIDGDTLGVVTGVHEERSVAPITVHAFPNPCAGSTTIDGVLPVGVTEVTLSVCDITGTEVLQYRATGMPLTLSTASLPSGTYWCTLSAGRYTAVQMVCVQR